MAYLAVGTQTYTVKDECKLGTYSGKSKTATVKVSISADGVVSWSVNMASDALFKGSFYLKLGTSVFYDGYYKGTASTDVCGNGYANSGTFNITGSSLAVDIRLCSGQDFHSSESRFNGSSGETTIKQVTIYRATAVTAGTVSIRDNYNNSYTVTGTRGTGDTSNPVLGHELKWATATSSGGWSYGSSTTNLSQTISFNPINSNNTIQVAADIITDGTYNDTSLGWQFANISQYVGPSAPGVPEISYSKSKLTIKEPWTFTWSPATATNSRSPVVGYRIRLYQNGVLIPNLALKPGSTTELIRSESGTEAVDTGSTNCYVTIANPADFGFKPKDTVRLGIYAYTLFGANNNDTSNVPGILYNGNGLGVSQVNSLDYLIQNAGILKIQTEAGLTEAQVYVVTAPGILSEVSSIKVQTEDGLCDIQ